MLRNDSDRNGIGRATVYQALISDHDGREDPVHGRGRHDRFRERAGTEVHGLAGVEIGGRDNERLREIFDPGVVTQTIPQVAQERPIGEHRPR